MIERQTINGRDATIAYFDDQFTPIDDLSLPHLAKVLFDDGEMILLRREGEPAPVAEKSVPTAADPRGPNDDDSEEHEHDAGAWAKHRVRTGQKKPIKIHGHELAHWARNIAAQDAQRIHTAISVGLTAGEDNTDIAHRVIGSRRLNGSNGATEITRQHILRLGKGLLLKRKSRMRGA
jgi:hypothetical protein